MKKVKIYTDGACSGNPGRGGYGVILEYNGRQKEISKGYRKTTNNRMELMAVIAGLSALKEPCDVEVFSDSKYVVDAIVKEWVYTWEEKGWIKSDKKVPENLDLIQAYYDWYQKGYRIDLRKVKGHAGHKWNEMADGLATGKVAPNDYR